MNPYIGHASQLGGAEMHRLVGGKGDGMRLLELRNGLGLEMTLCPDRALDISRLLFKGVQMSYMSPCGYVAPAYYESTGTNWLKSFTAGSSHHLRPAGGGLPLPGCGGGAAPPRRNRPSAL